MIYGSSLQISSLMPQKEYQLQTFTLPKITNLWQVTVAAWSCPCSGPVHGRLHGLPSAPPSFMLAPIRPRSQGQWAPTEPTEMRLAPKWPGELFTHEEKTALGGQLLPDLSELYHPSPPELKGAPVTTSDPQFCQVEAALCASLRCGVLLARAHFGDAWPWRKLGWDKWCNQAILSASRPRKIWYDSLMIWYWYEYVIIRVYINI